MSDWEDWDADLYAPWDAAFRVQRDVALRIPINYVTVPGVSLTAACFQDGQYQDERLRKCFSNLLGAGFRRFFVDVYWDAGRKSWSLCPVELGGEEPTPEDGTPNPSREVREAAFPTSLPWKDRIRIWPRQESSGLDAMSSSSSATRTATVTSINLTNNPTSTSSLVPTPSPTDSHSGSQPGLQVGPYNCTSSITLSFLADVLQNQLEDTSTTLDAFITYLILNVHAAAPFSNPNSPAQKPSQGQLPAPDNLISKVINGNLSDYLYTPNQLRDERNNVDDTWFDVANADKPISGYYRTQKVGSNLITSDGWPTESYMEFKEYYRLLVTFGTIDPQMSSYNLSADASLIFAPGTISSLHNTTFSPSGDLESGCLFTPPNPALPSSPHSNSSWASSLTPPLDLGPNPNTSTPIPEITTLTSCGLSSLLNHTLANANFTADANRIPYLAFAHSTLWSFAPGEPTNHTDSEKPTHNRCAAIYAHGEYPGRWRTVDCAKRYKFACQNAENPYLWSVTTKSGTYTEGATACPQNTTFSVPHTALENSYLISSLSSTRPSLSPNEPILLNLNALDVPNCWVFSVDSTCPYTPPTDQSRTRIVVVPAVAAVIVFVITALTVFVKCASNRREGKRGRRRRGVGGGWDYEGVPS
ncbi:hypothetical protein GQ43DRAFT_402614, partial [Delitschia confertaspora ATCC 74209]